MTARMKNRNALTGNDSSQPENRSLRPGVLEVRDLRVSLSGREILHQLTFSLPEGQWLMVTGPNGAGKTTLLRALVQAIPYEGTITFAGEDLSRLKSTQRARLIGVLPQSQTFTQPFTVQELVSMGRYAWREGPFGKSDPEGRDAVEQAMEETHVAGMRQKSILQLSGGEQQRVQLAQVFAQNPKILLLDEPTSHLDLPFQMQIFALIRQWLSRPGRSVICVAHDLSFCKARGTRALLLQEGRIFSQGLPDEVFSRENLAAVYHMDVYACLRELGEVWR